MAKSKSKPTKRKLTASQIVFYVLCILIVASMLAGALASF